MGLLVGDWANSNIGRFTHNGAFVNVVPVPFSPLCISLMPYGLIATSNSKKSQVCIIDMKSKQEISTLDINNASAICYHEQSDTLLVGRCLGRDTIGELDGNGVTEQYCPTSGRLVVRLCGTQNGPSSPLDMVLTFDNKLIVSDYNYVLVNDITCWLISLL